jgi:hypothetical protein
MAKALKIKQFGFDGKNGVAAITMVSTPDGRLGFFHQTFDAERKARSIRNGQSKPVYIDGELSTAEITQVKKKCLERVTPNKYGPNCSAIITNHKD